MIDYTDFYAVAPANRCVYRPTRDLWINEAVDNRLPPRPVLDANGNPVRSGGKVKMIPASKWLAQHCSVERMTWAPGEPEVIEDKLLIDDGWIEKAGARTYNTYMPPTIRLGDPAQARRWLEHWYKLYPRDIAEHCIAWLAHRRQYPGIKPNHGLVFIGDPDIGKDTLLVPVRYAVGTWNFRDIALNDLAGKNNDFLCAVIVRVNEARDVGDANRGRIDRYGLHDHMKALMASPPETHRINRKYVPEYISRSAEQGSSPPRITTTRSTYPRTIGAMQSPSRSARAPIFTRTTSTSYIIGTTTRVASTTSPRTCRTTTYRTSTRSWHRLRRKHFGRWSILIGDRNMPC